MADEDRLERLARQRAEQGLPPTIEDPVVLRRVAAIAMADVPQEEA